MDLDIEINELQGKVLLGDVKIQEKLLHKMERKAELLRKKDERIREMEQMVQINPKAPEILGCAYVVPLSQMEYEQHYGMKRDDEVEAIAMNIAIEYEAANEWQAEDVSSQNLGYDIRSVNKLDIKRYICLLYTSSDLAHGDRSSNGFIDRILFIMPTIQQKARWNEKDISPDLESQWHTLLNRLINIECALDENNEIQPSIVTFSDEARKFLYKWQHEHADLCDNLSNEILLGIYCKLEIYIIRFCLLIQITLSLIHI